VSSRIFCSCKRSFASASTIVPSLGAYIEYARSDHLLIVYYAGYGFVGSDHHLYWAWYDLNPHSLMSFADVTLAILEKTLPDSNGKV
jgi:hypothetical protein